MSKVGEKVITEVVGDLVKSNFKNLAVNCPDRIIDNMGEAVCCYHSDSASDCRLGICPKLDLSLDTAADLEKTEERRRGKRK